MVTFVIHVLVRINSAKHFSNAEVHVAGQEIYLPQRFLATHYLMLEILLAGFHCMYIVHSLFKWIVHLHIYCIHVYIVYAAWIASVSFVLLAVVYSPDSLAPSRLLGFCLWLWWGDPVLWPLSQLYPLPISLWRPFTNTHPTNCILSHVSTLYMCTYTVVPH